MSAVLLAGLKIGYLALLWLFILLAVNVIRTDLFGRRVPASELPAEEAPAPSRRPDRRIPTPPPPPAATRLVVTNGPQMGMAAEVSQAGTYVMIGRSPDCAILLDDDYVSTRHARVVNGVNGLYIEDLHSTNGSYVNGRRISEPTSIGLDDEIRIGKTLLRLES